MNQFFDVETYKEIYEMTVAGKDRQFLRSSDEIDLEINFIMKLVILLSQS
jgi:hypothetical protein